MAIRQVSIDTTESNVKQYVCAVSDSIFAYPNDCDAGSVIYIQDSGGRDINKVIYDGVNWQYASDFFDDFDEFKYEVLGITDDTITVDLDHKFSKNTTVVIMPTILQATKITVVGTITTAGDGECTITSVGTELPIVVSFPVLEEDDATAIALALRTALEEDVAVTELFTVSGEGAEVILTVIGFAENDATLNIALADDTCVGITTITESEIEAVGLTTEDKTFVFENFQRDGEISIFIHQQANCTFIFPTGVTFGGDSELLADKKHLLKFFTFDGGTNIYGKIIGTW